MDIHQIPLGISKNEIGQVLSYKHKHGFWEYFIYDNVGELQIHRYKNDISSYSENASNRGKWIDVISDQNGLPLEGKYSNGFWYEYIRDTIGNPIVYKDSRGFVGAYIGSNEFPLFYDKLQKLYKIGGRLMEYGVIMDRYSDCQWFIHLFEKYQYKENA